MAFVAIVSVALATLLSNVGLQSRLDASAQARLDSIGSHIAEIACGIYQ